MGVAGWYRVSEWGWQVGTGLVNGVGRVCCRVCAVLEGPPPDGGCWLPK